MSPAPFFMLGNVVSRPQLYQSFGDVESDAQAELEKGRRLGRDAPL